MAAAEHVTEGRVLMLLLLSIAAAVSSCDGHDLPLEGAEGCIENERRALLAIKSDMYDPVGWFSSWTGDDCCSWRGVACDDTTDGHVTQLDLRYPYEGAKRASKVNPSLLELKHLKYLDLSMNNFSGADIPEAIASLVHLEYLNLSHAMIAGQSPSMVGQCNLSILDLSDNNIDGEVANLFDSLLSNCPQGAQLSSLNLAGNNLNGLIPSSLEYFSQLEELDLSSNLLQGVIPQAFRELRNLKKLDLSENQLSGKIPRMLGLCNLSTLDLSYNNIGGDLTDLLHDLSSNCPQGAQLSSLNLAGNKLNGPMMLGLCNLSTLDLSYNNIGGGLIDLLNDLSSNCSQGAQLSSLNLADNNLNGLIPSSLEYFSQLEELDLSWNSLQGVIPQAFRELRNLKKLDLSENKLSGKIPMMLGLCNLSTLDLSYNNIGGDLTDLLHDLSSNCPQGPQLSFLYLQSNNLSGIIPSSLEYFSQLVWLELSSNSLQGASPQAFRELNNLNLLDLSENQLSGKIPRMLGLCNLSTFDLSYNNIGGDLTDLLHDLSSNCPQGPRLSSLYLRSNNLSGIIPSSLEYFSQLVWLDLSSNSLQGASPQAFRELNNLNWLDLSENQLSGKIPRMLGLCNLSTFDLSYNNIGGDLTDLLHDLSSNCPQGARLSALNLCRNNLSGTIPSSLGHLSLLEQLDLSSNLLGGNITEAHFIKLVNLDILNISYNSLDVILPHDWYPSFDASKIDMSFCNVRGKLPNWIQTQSQLKQLYLSRVGLSGNLPDWFSNFISNGFLREMVLSSNRFSGVLPSTTTTAMDLSNNSFVGPIPSSFFLSTGAIVLSLSYNNISGIIPSSFCNATLLRALDLSRNNLHGEIPSCHGSSPAALKSLHLNDNDLSGPLPSFLAQCKGLVTLDLGENQFYGEIPTWIGGNLSALQVLRLRSNKLHGIIPSNLSNLTRIQVLDLAFNELHGSIPSSFGSLSSMIKIQNNASFNIHQVKIAHRFRASAVDHYRSAGYYYLSNNFYKESIVITAKGSTEEYTTVLSLVTSMDLSNNNLSSEIPEELTNLLGLCFLSLAKNHLIGSIPRNIGAMKQLESLDLSFNDLEGEIPPSLSALYFLSHLNLSYNNLSGRIPTGPQLSTLNDSSIYAGNRGLCGIPLPECPRSDGLPREGEEEAEDDGRLEKVLEFAAAVLGFVVGFWGWVGYLILKQRARFALFRGVDSTCDWVYVQLGIRLAKLNSICRRRDEDIP